MKYFLLVVLFLNFLPCLATYTKGYYRKNGTYVKPYYRTKPNQYKFDNYSSKYNYNPTTGKRGTKNPYKVKLKY